MAGGIQSNNCPLVRNAISYLSDIGRLDVCSRNIVCDKLRQLPNDESAVRRYPRKSVPIYSHICDDSRHGKCRRELKERAIATGSRDHANTT